MVICPSFEPEPRRGAALRHRPAVAAPRPAHAARQRGAELPLIISDHADWPELIRTIEDTGAQEIWVTHGREDALLHQIKTMGLQGQALSLVGYEDEDETG